MRTNLEVLSSFDLIIATSIMQSADESVSVFTKKRVVGAPFLQVKCAAVAAQSLFDQISLRV